MREGANARWDEELVGLLQYLFITTRKYDINTVSKAMGMEYADLYQYVSGRRTLPAPLLRKLAEVTHDKTFVDVVFVGSPIKFFWTDDKHHHSGDLTKEMAEIGEAIGAVYGELRKALEDGKITSRESAALATVINGARLHLDDLQEIIQKHPMSKEG